MTFLNGTTVIGIDRTPPYEATFVVPAGAVVGSTLVLTARAADFSNNAADSVGSLNVVATPDTEPPAVLLSAPAEILAGAILHLTATATDNVKVSSVLFIVDGVPVSTLVDGPYTLDVATSKAPGSVIHSRAIATDATGLQASSDADTRVVAPASGTGAISGEVYDDGTGLPLAGATVVPVAPAAAPATATTDAQGRYDLPADAGVSRLRISKQGYTTSDRVVIVQGDLAAVPVDARLTPVAGTARMVSAVLGASITGGAATLAVTPGALLTDTALEIVPITPQGLQGLLPRGWSPVAVVDVLPHGVSFGGGQRLTAVADGLPPDALLLLAGWDEVAGAWRAIAPSVAGPSGALAATIDSSGQFAWLLADTTPVAPPVPVPGVLVGGVDDGGLPDAAAVQIAPQPRVVFYKPGVHSQVAAALRPGAATSSGAILRSRITESYRFAVGSEIHRPSFDQDIVFYQAPGQPTLFGASFPVTPSLIFDPQDLQQGVIGVELHTPADGGGTPLVGPAGGTVRAGTGETLQLPPAALDRSGPISLEPLSAAAAGVPLPASLRFLGAVSIGIPGGRLLAPAVLSIPRPASFDEASPVIVLRLAEVQQATRLVLVGTGRAIGSKVQSEQGLPGSAVQLDGILEGGRYIFAQGVAPLGFAAGIVASDSGAPTANVLVSSDGLPVVGISAATGRYVIAGLPGSVTLTALDPSSLAVGSAQGSLPGAATAAIDLRLASRTLQVASIAPADGAISVGLSTPVTATFSAPLDPASIAGPGVAALTITDSAGTVVAGSLTLSEGSRKLTFRPSAPLLADTAYLVTVTTTARDITGRALGAPVMSHFQSLDTSAPAPPAAGALSASIPDAGGLTTVRATQGTADPHDTVQILNLTRHTFFPALVNPDGSFSATFTVSRGDRLQVAITLTAAATRRWCRCRRSPKAMRMGASRRWLAPKAGASAVPTASPWMCRPVRCRTAPW